MTYRLLVPVVAAAATAAGAQQTPTWVQVVVSGLSSVAIVEAIRAGRDLWSRRMDARAALLKDDVTQQQAAQQAGAAREDAETTRVWSHFTGLTDRMQQEIGSLKAAAEALRHENAELADQASVAEDHRDEAVRRLKQLIAVVKTSEANRKLVEGANAQLRAEVARLNTELNKKKA